MSTFREFWYDNQLKRYLIQFCAIFADMNVQVGWNEDKEPRLAKVPIYAASKDRVVAAIKSENTQNKPIRIPALSAAITSIELAPERRKGIPNHRRHTVMPTGGLFPDDIKVVEQRMPVPYNLTMELGVWASNQDQHYQILEQIMMIFNPMLQIQTSDEALDWTQITTVELTGIRPEENLPAGAERRLIQTMMEFSIPVYISVPANVHDKYIRDIYIRVGAVSQSAQTSEDIIAELDLQGIPYELNFSLDDVEID
jgi:hypothetical protein